MSSARTNVAPDSASIATDDEKGTSAEDTLSVAPIAIETADTFGNEQESPTSKVPPDTVIVPCIVFVCPTHVYV